MESELFGYERGAFTSAVSSKRGLLEVAHRGTVFLDEVGDVPASVQPKLLKVLEEKRFRRLGDVRDREVDIRLISATNHDLAGLVRSNSFRSDLYYRISAIPLRVPPLRERIEDIPALANSLLEQIASDMGRATTELASDAVDALLRYRWPGNVRELRNVLEHALLFSEHGLLAAKDLRFDRSTQDGPAHSALTLAQMERLHIEQVLQEENGHVERAARRLGIPRSSLYQKIKRFKEPNS